MKLSFKSQVPIRAMALGALLAGVAMIAGAQQQQQTKPPQGPPVTTKGATKAAPEAAKGQATAESKRVEARERKAENTAEKTAASERRRALKVARNEPKALIRGIKLSKEEREKYRAVQKQHTGDFEALEKEAEAAEKAGTPDASILAKIEEARTRERAELRATLSPQAQAQFDKNAAAYPPKKKY